MEGEATKDECFRVAGGGDGEGEMRAAAAVEKLPGGSEAVSDWGGGGGGEF